MGRYSWIIPDAAQLDRICKNCGQRFGKHRGGVPEHGDSYFACPPKTPFANNGLAALDLWWRSTGTVFVDLDP